MKLLSRHFLLIQYMSIAFTAVLLVVCLCMAACSEESILPPTQPNTPLTDKGDSTAVEFYLSPADSSMATRTTWDDLTFPDGALIGIFVVDEDGTVVKSNAEYKYSTSTKTFSPYSSSHTIYTGSEKKYSYYVYSPYKSTCRIDSIYTTLGSQSSAATLKTYDFLRAVNTSAARGASSVSLTFSHLMARLDIDISYFLNTLGYTEVSYSGIKLSYHSSGFKVNLKTGALTARTSTVGTQYQRGYTTSGVRHMIIDPTVSYTSGTSLGVVRFTNTSGTTVDVPITLDAALSVSSGSKNVIKLQKSEIRYTDWAFSGVSLNSSGSLTACATGTQTLTGIITEKRTKQQYLNGVAQGSATTETRTYTALGMTFTFSSGTDAFSIATSGGVATVTTPSENTTTSAKSGIYTYTLTDSTGTARSNPRGITLKQPANTLTQGTTSDWDASRIAASASTTSFPYTASTATLTYTAPNRIIGAVTTACGTVVQPARRQSASVTWSVGAWSTSSTATKASVSGTTLTVPANDGAARTATITATFSDGSATSFTISQAAVNHTVDVE